ncbi:hypothetical protein ACFLS0_01830 [Candidatus Bipolaricaulota bacterium]
MARVIGSYSLPAEVVNQLIETSKQQDRPISWLVRDALSLYLSQVIGLSEEEAISPGESSGMPFDSDLSHRIDPTRALIDLETNAFWQCVFKSYLSLLEKGIPHEN